jgi:hypothetical protein
MYLMRGALRHAQSQSSGVQTIMSDFIEMNTNVGGIDRRGSLKCKDCRTRICSMCLASTTSLMAVQVKTSCRADNASSRVHTRSADREEKTAVCL